MADILEGLGGVLAGNVEQDLLTTSNSKSLGQRMKTSWKHF